jgi:hypothetical protein
VLTLEFIDYLIERQTWPWRMRLQFSNQLLYYRPLARVQFRDPVRKFLGVLHNCRFQK